MPGVRLALPQDRGVDTTGLFVIPFQTQHFRNVAAALSFACVGPKPSSFKFGLEDPTGLAFRWHLLQVNEDWRAWALRLEGLGLESVRSRSLSVGFGVKGLGLGLSLGHTKPSNMVSCCSIHRLSLRVWSPLSRYNMGYMGILV